MNYNRLSVLPWKPLKRSTGLLMGLLTPWLKSPGYVLSFCLWFDAAGCRGTQNSNENAPLLWYAVIGINRDLPRRYPAISRYCDSGIWHGGLEYDQGRSSNPLPAVLLIFSGKDSTSLRWNRSRTEDMRHFRVVAWPMRLVGWSRTEESKSLPWGIIFFFFSWTDKEGLFSKSISYSSKKQTKLRRSSTRGSASVFEHQFEPRSHAGCHDLPPEYSDWRIRWMDLRSDIDDDGWWLRSHGQRTQTAQWPVGEVAMTAITAYLKLRHTFCNASGGELRVLGKGIEWIPPWRTPSFTVRWAALRKRRRRSRSPSFICYALPIMALIFRRWMEAQFAGVRRRFT